MAPSLHRRLAEAESAFLGSLASEGRTLDSFEREYSLLRDDLGIAFAEGSVDADTVQHVYTVSSRIAHVADSFLRFGDACDDLTSRFRDALKSHVRHILDNPSASTSNRRDVSLAAQWLTENYHNPYPSSAVRDHISQEAGWSRKDVDGWFTDARKRMGWSDIRRTFCGNRRSEVVQKASEFFKDQRSLSNPALESALAQMLMRVQQLFIEPFKSTGDDSVAPRRKGHGIYASNTHELASTQCSLSKSPMSCSVSLTRSSRKRRRSVDFTESYPNQLRFARSSQPNPQAPRTANCKRRCPSRSRPHRHPQTISAPTPPFPNPETQHTSPSLAPLAADNQCIITSVTSLDSANSIPRPNIPLLAQIDKVHGSISRTIPDFSYVASDLVLGDQLAHMRTADPSTNFSFVPSFYDDTSLDTLCGAPPSDPIEHSLCGFLGGSISNNLLAFPPPPIDLNQAALPPCEIDGAPTLSELSTAFNPFLILDPSASQHDNWFFANLFENIPIPATTPSTTNERVKQLTQLEVLKEQQNQLQVYIQSLESQIGNLD